jgi:hypothetical protein
MIWVQVLMLRAQIRAAYGRGVVYRWSLTPNLRVYLVRIEWIPGQKADASGRSRERISMTASRQLAIAGRIGCLCGAIARTSRTPGKRACRLSASAPACPLTLPLPET